jgi:hypothetical protein
LLNYPLKFRATRIQRVSIRIAHTDRIVHSFLPLKVFVGPRRSCGWRDNGLDGFVTRSAISQPTRTDDHDRETFFINRAGGLTVG